MEVKKEFFDELEKLQLHNDAIKEIILVHGGVKPSTRITLSGSQLKSFQEFSREYGLYITESDHKVIAKGDTGKGGWKNKVLGIVDKNSKEGDPSYYIARSKEMVDEAKDAEFLDSNKFGQSLGYPKCCQEFFKQYFILANKKQCDFVLYTLSETKEDYPYDFYNNYASRYFGYSLLSHFPCSFNCKESSNLAKNYYEMLKKYSKKWANTFLYCQKSAIIYTEYRGIFLLKNFELDGNVLRYGDSYWLYSTIINKNLHILNGANNILINSKNNFSARKGERVLKNFRGENVGLMIFG